MQKLNNVDILTMLKNGTGFFFFLVVGFSFLRWVRVGVLGAVMGFMVFVGC